MKEKILFFSILLLLFMFPLTINAASYNLTVSCDHCDSYRIVDNSNISLSGPIEEGTIVNILGVASYGYLYSNCTSTVTCSRHYTLSGGTITMPNHDVSVSLNYGVAYKVDWSNSEPGSNTFYAMEGPSGLRPKTWTSTYEKWFLAGDTVYFYAKPQDGYILSSISGLSTVYNPIGSAYTYQFSMPASNVMLVPVFNSIATPSYSITKSTSDSNISIQVGDGSKTTATAGETVRITLIINSGYELNTITGASFTKVSANEYTFVMPNYNVSISVSSKATTPSSGGTPPSGSTSSTPTTSGNNQNNNNNNNNISYNIVLAETYKQYITIDKTSAKKGELVTFQILPYEGYKFKGLKSINITKVDETTYTFIMPSNDISIEPEFVDDALPLYNITLKKPLNGTVELSQVKALASEVITMTITPNEGYQLDEIKGINYQKNGDTYSFTVIEDTTIEVTFKKEEKKSNFLIIVLTGIISITILGVGTFLGIKLYQKKTKDIKPFKEKDNKTSK